MTGDGKTSVRGGAGVFYDRYSDDNILDLIELPPLLLTYTTNYTTIPELLSSPLTATPTAVRRITDFTNPPVVYNWSVGVQRDVGWQLVADVAYVGNAARDQLINRPINGQPLWLRVSSRRAWIRPTSSTARRSRCPTIYLRPYAGIRRDHAARVHGVLRLPLAAVLGEPPADLRRAVGWRGLHVSDLQQDPGSDRSVRVGQSSAQLQLERPASAHARSSTTRTRCRTSAASGTTS